MSSPGTDAIHPKNEMRTDIVQHIGFFSVSDALCDQTTNNEQQWLGHMQTFGNCLGQNPIQFGIK